MIQCLVSHWQQKHAGSKFKAVWLISPGQQNPRGLRLSWARFQALTVMCSIIFTSCSYKHDVTANKNPPIQNMQPQLGDELELKGQCLGCVCVWVGECMVWQESTRWQEGCLAICFDSGWNGRQCPWKSRHSFVIHCHHMLTGHLDNLHKCACTHRYILSSSVSPFYQQYIYE